MIRLKHSEITLTPADVEETRRRMERRQAANAPATLPARSPRRPVPPGFGARLRRGPRRSRDDSVKSLGDVPILRPQQAVHASVDELGDPPRPVRGSHAESSEAVSSELTSSPLPDNQTPLDPSSATGGLAGPLPGSDIRLPFRLAPQDRYTGLFASQEAASEDTPSPSKVHLNPPRMRRARTNSSEPGSEEPSPSLYPASTDGNVDSATTLQTPTRHRARSLRQYSVHIPSPLQHVQRISSPMHSGPAHEEVNTGNSPGRTAATGPTAVGAGSPPRFIRGYWDSHQRYRFVECAPRTEPRPRTAQPFRRGRTMSSSSEPSHLPRVRRPHTSDSSIVEDIFWNTPAPEPPFGRDNDGVQNSTESSNDRYWSPLGSDDMGYGDPIRITAGRHSSGTSTTSQPYSFYELPDSSRHSSSTYSQAEPLAQSQYDGAAPSHQASRDFSRGAYYSICLPASRAASGAHLRPPPALQVPSTPSLDLTALGQHGLSPLLARPYSRAPSAQHPLIPSAGLVNVTDFVGGDQDASRAVQRDLSSPLELIQERANAYFQRISTSIAAASSQPRAAEPRSQHLGQSEEAAGRLRRMSESSSLRHESGNSTHGRIGAQPRARMNFAPIPVPVSDPLEHAPPVQIRISQVPRRPVNAARAVHRSSENAPVSQAQDPHPAHMPTQRASLSLQPSRPASSVVMRGGELTTPPVMARFSVPQVPGPRDMSNRPPVHSPHPLLLSSDDDPYSSDTLTPVPSTAARITPPDSLRDPRLPPRYASGQDLPSDAPQGLQRQPPRRTVTPIPAPLPFGRQPERGLPSTSTTLDSASGTTSWRPVARAATSRRRVDAEQENSEERERADMRGGMESVGWRMGSEGRADVMEETPPRVGRYERFLFS